MELVVDTSFQLAQKIGLKRALAVHTEDSLCTAAAEVDPALPAAAAKQAVTMLAQPRPPVNLNTFKRARAGHLPVPAAVHKRPVASNPAQPAERRLGGTPVSKLAGSSAPADVEEDAEESRPIQEEGPRAAESQIRTTGLIGKSFKRGPVQADQPAKPSAPPQRKAPTLPQWLLEPSDRILAEARRLFSCAPQELRALGVPQLKILLKELKVPYTPAWGPNWDGAHSCGPWVVCRSGCY